MEETREAMDNKTFMIIDDDKIMHFVNSKLIRMACNNPNIITYMNGKDALDYLSAHQADPLAIPDVILLDLDMPVMNGWAFLEQLSAIGHGFSKKPFVYILSSSNFINDLMNAKKYSDVKGYFVKPLTSDCLQAVSGELRSAAYKQKTI